VNRVPAHADWIAGLRWEDLPEPVRRQARRCLKDIVATAAGSLALPAAAGIERLVAAQFVAGPAPMLFRGPRTTLAGAAFGNALRIDGLDCHDGFRPNKGHAGATVVPVLLAAAARGAASGAELLAALVAGYEVALRAGLALHATYAPAPGPRSVPRPRARACSASPRAGSTPCSAPPSITDPWRPSCAAPCILP
jgi:2-methylcitrate dehydratase PrpD